MSQPQTRPNDPFRRAIRKLVLGLEKREQVRSERRRHNRHPFNVKVHLCNQVGTDQYQPICEAWAVDLSMGGICCLVEQAINCNGEGDDTVFVSFEELLGRACYIPMNVRRCFTLIGNIYQVTGQFTYDGTSDPGKNTQVA